MIQLFGHLHPLLVHLPIGILIIAFILECLARWFQQEQLRPSIRIALLFGLAASILSVASGLSLAENGGYDEATVLQHRNLGIATMCLFGLVWLLQNRGLYMPVFCAAILSLVLTGHFGGVLTHGEGYLFQTKQAVQKNTDPEPISLSPETPIFSAIIQPILEKKCGSCHGQAKRKGNLVLLGQEDILAGGKHGQVVIPGNLDSSSLWQRIQLPLQHDDHMPPAGKTQLSSTEMQLLKWWIAEVADFQALLKDHPLPPALVDELNAVNGGKTNPVFSLSVPAASASSLERLKSLHIQVLPLGENLPWLSVSLAGQQEITASIWDALEGVSAQLVELDLSHSHIAEKQLSGKSFPHLIRLNLAHSGLGNEAVSFIAQSKYLESLNLSNTKIGDDLQGVLPQMPELKKLFLWQSAVTPEAMAAWEKQYPGLQIEKGAAFAEDTPLVLKVPKIRCGRAFFDDTMHVELDLKFPGVEIYYTLDEEASPTTQSSRYTEPIVLEKTAHLRAFAAKNGWQNSPLVESVFVKKKYTLSKATLTKPPSPKYPFKGAPALIDGKISDYRESDTWLGYEGEHLEATLDLGEQKAVSAVFVHCLEYNGAWIHLPSSIRISVSDDGKKFTPQTTIKIPENKAMGEHKPHLISCRLPSVVNTRFVRVNVQSLLKNPSWHPGKGQKCWIFVDEMLVE